MVIHEVPCSTGSTSIVDCEGLAGNYDVYCQLTLTSTLTPSVSSRYTPTQTPTITLTVMCNAN